MRIAFQTCCLISGIIISKVISQCMKGVMPLSVETEIQPSLDDRCPRDSGDRSHLELSWNLRPGWLIMGRNTTELENQYSLNLSIKIAY